MVPPKHRDDESSDESSDAPDTQNYSAAVSRRKFDDEEGEDSDVLDSWDAAEDSEVEREKARKAEEAKAKAEATAKANKKSKLERIAMHVAERKAAKDAAEAGSSDDETEDQKRRRLRAAQKEADLRHAEDLFGDVGNVAGRRSNNTTLAAAVVVDPSNPNATVDLGALPLFNPKSKTQLEHLGKTVAPLLAQHHKVVGYVPFFQEMCKVMAKELPSEQVKKIASTLTAVSNEKMRAEKASEKTGKKKGKAKTTLVTTRNNVEDVAAYNDDEAFGDDDFM